MPPATAAQRVAARAHPYKTSKPSTKNGAQPEPKSSLLDQVQQLEPSVIGTQCKESNQLLAGRVESSQATKALKALLSFYSQTIAEDFGPIGDEVVDGDGSDKKLVVFVQITLNPSTRKPKRRTHRIPLAHALFKRNVCLLTPDPQRWWKDALVERGATVVDRVVGASQLAKKFSGPDARRKLMDDHDLFLADDRLKPVLPKLLGPKWTSNTTKRPINIDLRDPTLIKDHLQQVVCSTTYQPAAQGGGSATIRLGHLRVHTTDQLLDNLGAVLGSFEGLLPGGWKGISALDVKLATSAAMPIWRPATVTRSNHE